MIVRLNIDNRDFPQYRGMSYEQASREASRLIERAQKTNRWIDIVEALAVLRETMRLMKRAA